jgi:hypothetical protein
MAKVDGRSVWLEVIPNTRFGEQEARARRIGLDLLAQLHDIDT